MNADPSTDQAMIKDTLRTLTAGYLSVADCPVVLFSRELGELYPDAVVICTTRDSESWINSLKEVMKTVYIMKYLDILFLPLPPFAVFWNLGLCVRE